MDVAKQGGLWTKIKPAKPTRLQQEARIGLLFLIKPIDEKPHPPQGGSLAQPKG